MMWKLIGVIALGLLPSYCFAGLLEKAQEAATKHEFSRAAKLYGRLVSREPQVVSHKIAYAKNLYYAGRLTQAEDIMVGVLAGVQPNTEALLLLTDMKITQGQWQGARVLLDSVPDNERNTAEYYFKLAQVEEKLGNKSASDEALSHYYRLRQSQ